MFLYCSGIMDKCYSGLGFHPIKHNEKEKNHNEIFNNVPHFIKNDLHVNFLQDSFLCTMIK